MSATASEEAGLKVVYQLSDLIDIPVAVIRHERIMYANAAFWSLVGFSYLGNAKTLPDMIQSVPVLGAVRSVEMTGVASNIEVVTVINGREMWLFADILPLVADKLECQYMALIDMTPRFKLEQYMLATRRKTSRDVLWVLDGRHVVSWDSTGRHQGEHVDDLITSEGKAAWESLVVSARRAPWAHVSGQVPMLRNGASRQAEVELTYAPFFGDRYYVVSRTEAPKGNQVIERLREACGCESDAGLAVALGVSKSGISRARARESLPPFAWLLVAHERYGASLDWLISGIGKMKV